MPPRHPPRGVERPVSGLAGHVAVLSLVALFAVSGGALWSLGYNYDGLTGAGASKIHPGTYLAVAALALAAMADGNPVRFIAETARRNPGSVALFAIATLVLARTAYRSGPGLAGIIDTDMLPAIVAVLILEANRTVRDRMETALHQLMVANAVLGLVELAGKQLLFPYRFDGIFSPYDLRSTALQGHPLINAILTSCYLLALVSGGGRLSTPVRAAAILLQAMALVAFGGRSALLVTMLLGGAAAATAAVRVLLAGRVPLLGLAATLLATVAAPIALAGLWAGGFFDAILDRVADDGGSAHARVEMLALLGRIPIGDLLIGPDTDWVDSLRRTAGLELGIENPVVRAVLYQGILMTALLVTAVAWFLRDIVRRSRPGLLLPILAFVIVANTFESLGTKTTLLAKFVAILILLFRPERVRRAALVVRRRQMVHLFAAAGPPGPRRCTEPAQTGGVPAKCVGALASPGLALAGRDGRGWPARRGGAGPSTAGPRA